MPKRRRNAGGRPLTFEEVAAACDVIVVCDLDEIDPIDDEDPRPLSEMANPLSAKTKAMAAAAIGLGIVVGGLGWWLFRKKPSANAKGKVICPTIPYPGPLALGDFVVVELGSADGSMSEPTWGKVIQRKGASGVVVELVGETGEDNQPVPLSTDRHGYSIGDRIELQRSCIFDRFRPGQRWHVLCGPALVGTGYTPIAGGQASLLGVDDRAQVVVQGPRGGTEAIWLTIDHVSVGMQTISGVVLNPTTVTDHGLGIGDVVQFLRDCVVDAEFN